MARQLPPQERESREQDQDGIHWGRGADTSSRRSTVSMTASFRDTSFAQHEQVPTVSASFVSSWNLPNLGSHDQSGADCHAFQALSPPNSVSPYLLGTYSPFFLSPVDVDLTWQIERELDHKQTMLQSGLITGLPNIDVGFNSGFLSFTQCLQEGMKMDVSDYSDLSKTVGATLDTSESQSPGFAQQERVTFPRGLFEPEKRHMSSSFSSFATQDEMPSSCSVVPSSSITADAQAGGASGEASTVPSTPTSSVCSSSSDGHDDKSSCGRAMGVGVGEHKQTATKTLSEVVDKSTVEAVKKPSKPRKKGQKRNREPRIALVTKSDVEHLEDGYRWRKYGQKAVKNSPYPRSYYRCTNIKCLVKKRVERSFEDPSMVITTYEGQHTHHSPAVLTGSGSTEALFFGGGDPCITSFNQSPYSSSLQNLPLQASLLRNFDLSVQLQGQGRPQHRCQDHELPPCQRSSQPLSDKGLLEDILPCGVHKFS